MSAEQTKWRNLLLNILKNSCVGILCLISQGLLHTHSATCCPGIPQSFRNRDHVSRLSQKRTLRDLAAQWPVLTRTQFGFGKLLAWILLSSCIITSRSEEYHPWAAQEVLSLLLGRTPQRGLARWLYSEGREEKVPQTVTTAPAPPGKGGEKIESGKSSSGGQVTEERTNSSFWKKKMCLLSSQNKTQVISWTELILQGYKLWKAGKTCFFITCHANLWNNWVLSVISWGRVSL